MPRIPNIATLSTLLGCLISFSAASPASTADYRLAHPARHQTVIDLLADHSSQEDLDRFVGRTSARCVDSSPGLHACQWEMNKRHPGWEPLSRALETQRTIALVCDLPKNGSDRAKHSCFAVPRQSNRTILRNAVRRLKDARGAKSQRKIKAITKQFQDEAKQHLDRATTFFEIVRLVGAVPESCQATASAERRCLWRTHARTYGHGTVAATITRNMSKKVRLECVLPAEGGARRPGSCVSRIGG